ncbi:hypothetical protein FQZ97_1207200 [compost metagenome]
MSVEGLFDRAILLELPVADADPRCACAALFCRLHAGHLEHVGQAMDRRLQRAGINDDADLRRFAFEWFCHFCPHRCQLCRPRG